MILVDDPSQRHMCPVTLFLSMAIADGVIDGIDTPEDLAALDVPASPEWTSLPYRTDFAHLPVLRRSGNKPWHICNSAIKPYTLNSMIQAQVDRAGHRDTFLAITEDAHNTVSKEKKSKSPDNQYNVSNAHHRDHYWNGASYHCR